MIQALVDAAQGGCRGGNSAFVDTGVDDIDQAFVTDVFVGCAGSMVFSQLNFSGSLRRMRSSNISRGIWAVVFSTLYQGRPS